MSKATRRLRGAELVAHWSKLFEGLEAASLGVYVAVEEALERRQIPNLKVSRVRWREGGTFSAKREYLRAERRQCILDICAAPFGSGFFFSYWLSVVRPWFTIAHFAGMAATAAGVAWLCFPRLVIPLLVLHLVSLVAMSKERDSLESFLLGMTIIGPFIDLFFRRTTYFEFDTALMFQAASHAALMEVIDQLTSTQGVRSMTDDERKPILRDFFKK